MKDIQSAPEFNLQLVVSGAHLSPEFGLTYKCIEEDGFQIDDKIEMLLSSDTPVGTAKSTGLALLGLTDSFHRLKPNFLVVLGDRYEAFAAAQAAYLLRIPVVHLSGGEITEGAYDDALRHAITKLSYLHFTSNERYKQRVIQLGESPERVFNVGSIGLEHLKRTKLLTITELSKSLGFQLDKPFFLVTYHPVTLASEDPCLSFQALLDSLEYFSEFQVIITYPNSDDGGRKIIPMLEEYASKNSKRVLAISSLGQLRYLSAVKHTVAVIGNSSSGIAEVPSFSKPTVNIGARQKGRLMASSILHCNPTFDDIKATIKLATETRLENVLNPYGSGNTSKLIIDELKAATNINLTKKFYDMVEN